MLRRTLRATLRSARARLPGSLDPFIERAKDVVHDVRGLAALSSWVYAVHRGPLPHGGPDLEVHYLGRALLEGDALLAYRPHADAGGWRRELQEEGGLVSFLAARRDPTTAHGLSRGNRAPVLLVDPLFDWIGGLEGAFRHPVFLRAMLPVSSSFEEQLEQVRSKPYRRVLRRAHKQAPRWRISRDVDELRDFHATMYQPLAHTRFGAAASVSSLERLTETLQDRGELLLVEHEGKPVIGSLLYRSPADPGTLFNWKYGIRGCESLDAPTQRELTARLEVALFEHALKERDTSIDFGLTHAVANDGIYVHKRRLGCNFTPLPHGPELLWRFAEGAEPGVLERSPVFVVDDCGLRCLTGYTGAKGRDGDAFTKGVLRECTFEGCSAVSLFALDDAEDVAAEVGFPVEITVRDRTPRRAVPTSEMPPRPARPEARARAAAHGEGVVDV